MFDSVRFKVPKSSTDCGAHIYGPFDRFPTESKRPVSEATIENYLGIHDELGIERGVLTQPSDYGVDNSCLLEAVASRRNRLRAVIAAAPESLTDNELECLEARGACGVRLRKLDDLEATAERLRGTNWHIEVVARGAEGGLAALRPRFERLGLPVVFGHMGDPEIGEGTSGTSFHALIGMLRDGFAWVKLALPFHHRERPIGDAVPFARALLEANPKRCLFALGWPHVAAQKNPPVPDDGFLFDLLAEWAPGEGLRRQVLVENPEELYRF